jgi:protein-tyrosine phosphatase
LSVGTVTIASVTQRTVTFTDLFNFRDLGGYPTSDGRMVAWGRLFRADNLGRLSAADQEAFAALGIRTVVDLRRPDELVTDGRLPATTNVDFRHLHLVYTSWPERQFIDLDERVSYLVDRYVDMSLTGAEAIGATLRLIADPAATPLVFHCLAGKDRTGIVAALTLSLLGVDDETVALDYALSEKSVAAFRARQGMEPLVLHSTPAAAMLGFLAGVRTKHGSVQAYARWLGLTDDDLAALRTHLLT